VNKNGNPRTLIASHPGNTNAARHGAYSPGLMEARATEIEQGLLQSFEFSAAQRFAVHEVAHYKAILEAIDRDLDDRGLVDKRRGEPRSIVNLRSSASRQLDRWLSKISLTMDRQTSDEPRQPAGHAHYVRELERIVSNDPSASARVTALNTLLKLDPGSTGVTHVTMNFLCDDDGKPILRPDRTEAVNEAEPFRVASPDSNAGD
jgi:hypothetical protein